MFRRRAKELVALVHGVQAELTVLREDIARRAVEVDAVRGGLQALEDRLRGVDARVTHMTTAITNQLHELDSEIDRLAKTADAASAETVSELRANQVRIAGEQARYAIALRQDLAELAEMLRRARG
jgi:predicted  nucleic acid-binding Zn-ribbon protein